MDPIDYDKSEGRALRLLELYFTIEEQPGIKADALVEQFGISQASLFRDIQSLRRMGIAIEFTSPNRGGYRIERGSIRFVRVKPEELKPILVARELLNQLAFPGGAIFDALLTKMLGTVREGDIERLDSMMQQHLYFRAPFNRRFDLNQTAQVTALSDLLESAVNHWQVSFDYPRADQILPRTVNPLGLWFGHNAWYLAGWCHERRAIRTFAVDRMQHVTVHQNKAFRPVQDFELSRYVETSWIARPASTEEEMTEIVVTFEHDTGAEIAGYFWHPSQHFSIPVDPQEPVIGRFCLSRASAESEFASWLLSFGGKILRVDGISA